MELFLKLSSEIANTADLDWTAPERGSAIWVCIVCIFHFVRNFGVQNFRTSIVAVYKVLYADDTLKGGQCRLYRKTTLSNSFCLPSGKGTALKGKKNCSSLPLQQTTNWHISYLFSKKKKAFIDIHAYCILRRHFAWNVKPCFLRQNKKNILKMSSAEIFTQHAKPFIKK